MAKNILITGASSGLGMGMAREFAARGHNLALCARRLESLQALQEELARKHPQVKVSFMPLDVNDHDQVFDVFGQFREEFGTLDRVIVNAGIGKGASIGTGYFRANRETMETNLIAALAQCEAAVEIFRAQHAGHLVLISSVSAYRGFPGALTAYAASKAGLATLGEGIRADLMNTPIKVTTIYPGFILTDINKDIKKAPFRVDLETGCRAMVKEIENEVDEASVPRWPWAPIGFAMRRLPLKAVAKMA